MPRGVLNRNADAVHADFRGLADMPALAAIRLIGLEIEAVIDDSVAVVIDAVADLCHWRTGRLIANYA